MTENERLRIHMTAICGVGMAPLAVALKRMGHEVRGSDAQFYPPMSEVLAEAGISLVTGFSSDNLEPRPDLVIVGNAVPSKNPEAEAIERLGLEKISFPQAVSRFLIGSSKSLVVAGTHGKTTTTGMLAFVLDRLGVEPGYLVGGRVLDLATFARAGRGEYFVVEGDEYDSAYFDKRPKFIHYKPQGVVLTSIEFDHADIYRDASHVESAFRDLLAILPTSAPLVACSEYDAIRRVVDASGHSATHWYGSDAQASWRYGNVRVDENGTRFDVEHRGRLDASLCTALVGEMNAANATAVYVMTRTLGFDRDAIASALVDYRGAARRQQLLGEAAGVLVIDDFAHHPTAVRMTLEAIRKRYPSRRLVAVFEPRSNTSRRAVFQREYAAALAVASLAIVSTVFAKANDPLRGDEMLSTERLVEDLEDAGARAWSADGPDEILARLRHDVAPGDVVVCMSNGAFGNLPRRLLSALGEADADASRARVEP
jgi:UDP-N-acetylmuramate: L-alanyl-gamma-D-glutamyl-meso-diaminopimelate ligase